MLELKKLSCGYRSPGKKKKVILKDFDLTIREGDIWCVLGKNGVGKTTLFKTILGTLPLFSGEMIIDGRSMLDMTRKEIAGVIAYVPQYHDPPFPFTVREIVVMGRNAYIGTFGSPTEHDVEIAEAVMNELEIGYLADREYTQISGGERQMVLIARALAQEPKVLMMDEPAANLDYGNQIRMLRQIRTLAEKGISVIYTSHNPEHAFLSRAKAAAIISGDKFIMGEADEIITENLIEEIYGIHSKVIKETDDNGETVSSIVPYL